MYIRHQAFTEALTALKKAIGKQAEQPSIEDLETPGDDRHGDIAFPCFALAKALGRNPKEIATELAAKIGPTETIAKIEAVGPYVNFYLDPTVLAERVLKEIHLTAGKYGFGQSGKGRHVLVEYAQPNTHKPLHIGHVRNALLGQSIIHVLRASGYKVTGASYIGDIGAHVAKSIWAILKYHKDEEFPVDERAKKLQEIYTEATEKVEGSKKFKKEVDEIQQQLEAREGEATKLWKETREWSLQDFKESFKDLGVTPDVWYFESDVEEPGKELVKKFLTDGIAKKSQGATIIDLEEEGLGVFLILKSDGSSLYATKDLALAYKKERDFEPDRQIFVVDNRQSLYFKQVFAALKRAGFTAPLTHVAYDVVTLPEGAMSSRKGNVVTYRELKDQLVDSATSSTQERHEDWSESEVDAAAEGIAAAAIAFVMLRQDPESIITFDTEEAMATDGFTGPYILYMIARIRSIFEKTKIKPKAMSKHLTHPSELALLKKMSMYPDVVQRVSQNFQVSSIAVYAFELAKLFAEYYHEVRILDEEKQVTAARLELARSVEQVLVNACELLTIKPLKHM